MADFLTFKIIPTGLKYRRLKRCKFLNWLDFFFLTSHQSINPSVQSSTYQGYTVRIAPFVLIIVFKKMLLRYEETAYLLGRNFIQITILALFKIVLHPIAQSLSRTIYGKNWNLDLLLLTRNSHPLSLTVI